MAAHILHSLRIDYPDRYLAAVGLLVAVGKQDHTARLHWTSDGWGVLTTDIDLQSAMRSAAAQSAQAWDSPEWKAAADQSQFARMCYGQEKFAESLHVSARVASSTATEHGDMTMIPRMVEIRMRRPGVRTRAIDRIAEWIDAPAPLYEDNHGMMGLSPRAFQAHAYNWMAPVDDTRVGCSVTLWLIGEALELYHTLPSRRPPYTSTGQVTAGWLNQWEFRWPQWMEPLSVDSLRGLVTTPYLFRNHAEDIADTIGPTPREFFTTCDVRQVWRCVRQHRGHNRGGLMGYGVAAIVLE